MHLVISINLKKRKRQQLSLQPLIQIHQSRTRIQQGIIRKLIHKTRTQVQNKQNQTKLNFNQQLYQVKR